MSVSIARRSQGPAGQDFNAASDFPALSADGGFIAFSTDATNSFLADGNGVVDIWRQASTGALERVSLTTAGQATDGASFSPSMSGDGRYVAFASLATNLTLADVNGAPDIFRKDMATGAVLLVSFNADGVPGNSVSFAPSISADGRYVAFLSAATNLVEDDLNGSIDTFLTDLVTSTTRLVSAAADGSQASSGSINRPSLSADARYVAFDSAAANLTASDANGRDDVFVKDMLTGEVRLATEGLTGNFEGTLRPAISADGRYVVFATAAALLAADTNGVLDVYRKDLLTGGLARVSVTAAGIQGNAASRDASVSADGRYVAFTTLAANFVDGDSAGNADVFLKDMVTGALTLLSRTTAGGVGLGQSVNAAISADGRVVGFASTVANLVAADGNAAQDVFAASIGPPAGTQTGTAGADLLQGSNGADTLLGLGGDDTLQGFDGPDQLEGGDGHDLMLGGPGNDAMLGGTGDDSYQVDSPGDAVIEQEDGGTDTVYVLLAGYALPANVEIARLVGDADSAAGGESSEQLVANAALASSLEGGAGDDVLWGQGLADTLDGGAGDDVLRGGGGQDRMLGGPGNDQAIIEQDGDAFIELADAGIDTAWVTAQGWTVPLHVEIGRLAGGATLLLGSGGGQSLVANPLLASTLRGGDGADTLYGADLADTLDGGAGDDILRGGAGADLLRGGLGNDSYVIDDLGDTVDDSGGADTAYVTVDGYVLGPGIEAAYLAGTASRFSGSAGADVMIANPLQASTLEGRQGDDTLYGSPLADVLAGGVGNDVMTGAAGADRFSMGALQWGEDWVMDFSAAEGDRLDFRDTVVPSFSQLAIVWNGPYLALQFGANSVTLPGVASIGADQCLF